MAKKTQRDDKQKESDAVSEAEAEKRATEALRRALTTPYKPQRDIKKPRKRNGHR